MKTMIRTTFFGLLCISVLGCTNKKKSTATIANQTATTASTTPVAAQPIAGTPSTTLARFVISFYSKGEGIDLKIKDEFVSFLNSYTKPIGYEPVAWGREGELDYCLSLNNFSTTEQAEFIKKANTILMKSKLVSTKENSACPHSNRVTVNTDDESYRLVASFYSKGEGIDLKNKEEFEKFLYNYPQKFAYEPTTWGREGETNYCLKLNELSATEQTDFVRKAKEILNKSTLVHITENAKCPN